MKLNSVIIYLIIFLFFITTDCFGEKSKIKPLYTVLVCNHETSFETFNGGLSYHIIKTNMVKEALKTKPSTMSQDVIDFNSEDMVVFPNPVGTIATLKFRLDEDAIVNIFSVDNFNNKQIHFSGFMEMGNQIIQVNFETEKKGLVLIYLEIKGKLSVFKIMKN